jgi:hypothetical protein
VVVFYLGLRRLIPSAWLALAVSSSLLYSNMILGYYARLLSDALGSSLAILTVGTLLLAVGRPRAWWAWAGLTVSLFLTYQTRPAYVCLLPLVPLLGLLLLGLVAPRPAWARRWKWVAGGLVAVAAVPFLAFCTLRWALVGDFGLVSFGGHSLAGIAGPLLTEDLVPRLPEDVRPLAAHVLEVKKWTAAGLPPESMAHMSKDDAVYRSMQTHFCRETRKGPVYDDYDDAVVGALYLLRDKVLERANEANFEFDRFAWAICDPAAKEVLQGGEEEEGEEGRREGGENEGGLHKAVNAELSKLSVAILKARPWAYLGRAARTFVLALTMTLVNGYALLTILLSALLFLLIWQALSVVYRLREGSAPPEGGPGRGREYSLELAVTMLIAVGFALSNLLVIAPTAAPTTRYTDAAGVFLPTVAVVGLFALGERVRSSWRAVRRKAREVEPG